MRGKLLTMYLPTMSLTDVSRIIFSSRLMQKGIKPLLSKASVSVPQFYRKLTLYHGVRYPVESELTLEDAHAVFLLSIEHFGKEHGSETDSATRWHAPNCSIHRACTALWPKR